MTPKEAVVRKTKINVWRNLYPEFGGKTLAPKFFDWRYCSNNKEKKFV